MKKIMCFGTFDVFHEGHRNYFCQAKKFGDVLTVVIARDVTVKKIKKRNPLHNENERLKIVNEEKIVNKAILGNIDNYFKVIEDEKPDIICLGYDQKLPKNFEKQLKESFISCEIIRLKSYMPNIYKSSKIKENSS